jgi:hypothetical protein
VNKETASVRTICLAVIIGFAIFITAIDVIPTASAHEVAICMVSSFVELDNEQFSSNNVTIGESIMVTGELSSRVNRELDVMLVPIVDKERVLSATGDEEFFAKCNSSLSYSYADDIAALEWQVVNASFSTEPGAKINIEPGGTAPFSLEIKGTEPGTFRLATGLIVVYTQLNGTETRVIYLGRGQTVQVLPTQAQLEACQNLGISSDKCSDIAILQYQQLQRRDRIIAEEQQEQFDVAMYMIGIGVAIAGIMAFITLRKRIQPKAQKEC